MGPGEKKLIVGLVIAFFVLFYFWQPDVFPLAMHAAGVVLIRMTFLAWSVIPGYMAYDAFRSAVTGTQSKTSAPSKDPASVSERANGIFLGGIFGLGTLLCIAMGLNLFGAFPS
jgi:hypothetical protein